jgi:Spy/CpxP family protein refolding chaperone
MNVETRKKAGLWLAFVFVLGAAVGGVFGYSFAHHAHAATMNVAPQLSEPERRAKRVADMTRELGLTAEQAARVDTIIHATHDEMKSVRDKCESDVEGLRLRAREQIRLLLTEEQKPKFEQMVQRMDAERKRTASQGQGK